ncbi:prephenate dehydrogenase [Actinoplanes solisilvae]|uniref:prephenate dehydrogenase n=1 Tax=Actinoplanes solisilvae TaxID=2486853 RepID=UPI001F0BA69D|nr:prephenate dehydrogenase/arogenate dehydrogenase family protein [Actinoplanes solisilvae]
MDIAIVGLGLIGGSLLRALTAAGHHVTGYDADPTTRDQASAAGFPVAGSVPTAISGTDLTILAVPLPALPGVLDEMTDYDGLVTDVTSVKRPVRDLAHRLRRFVGGHPMAGKETSGFAATEATLFDGCAWVLTLEPHETDLSDWLTLARLFTTLGARVVPTTAAEHDRAVAEVSHVPHLFAAALALQLEGNPLAGTLAAGSFRDGTRVAATRAELIVAMCGGNKAEVSNALSRLIGDLEQMRRHLESEDLTPTVRRAGDLRRAWPAKSGHIRELTPTVDALLDLGRNGGWVTAISDNGEVEAAGN